MKKGIWVIVLLLLAGISFQVEAQSVERSSGVKKLNMRKSSVDSKENDQDQKNPTRSSEGSLKVTLPMNPSRSVELNGEVNGFTWIAPNFTSVKTSESEYEIKATVNSQENIRFLNLFNNGQFIRNIIPPVSTIRQMVVEESMELHMGRNELKIEVITVSGKKLESSIEVVYDISSAKYVALIIAVEEYDDPDINDLDQPINDATRFSKLIQTEYNFDKENITLMENPSKARDYW